MGLLLECSPLLSGVLDKLHHRSNGKRLFARQGPHPQRRGHRQKCQSDGWQIDYEHGVGDGDSVHEGNEAHPEASESNQRSRRSRVPNDAPLLDFRLPVMSKKHIDSDDCATKGNPNERHEVCLLFIRESGRRTCVRSGEDVVCEKGQASGEKILLSIHCFLSLEPR